MRYSVLPNRDRDLAGRLRRVRGHESLDLVFLQQAPASARVLPGRSSVLNPRNHRGPFALSRADESMFRIGRSALASVTSSSVSESRLRLASSRVSSPCSDADDLLQRVERQRQIVLLQPAEALVELVQLPANPLVDVVQRVGRELGC